MPFFTFFHNTFEVQILTNELRKYHALVLSVYFAGYSAGCQ